MTTIEKPRPVARPEETPEADAYDLSKIQERHPDWPKLELSFYFANHAVKSDTENMAPLVAEADIILYEDVTRYEEYKAFFNQVATDPEKAFENPIWKSVKDTDLEPMVMAMKGTNKVAATMDIGKTVEEHEMAQALSDLVKRPVARVAEYSDAVRMFGEKCEEIAKLQSKREDVMVANFEEEIEQILASHPDLMQKNELKILASMGLYHTRLGHKFAEAGMKSGRHFSNKSYTYGYQNELVRSYAFHKEASNELMQRATAESIVAMYILHELKRREEVKSEMITAYLRNAVTALTIEDMEDLYDAYRGGHLTTKLLDRLLTSRGVYRLPRDKKELDYISEELHYKKERSLAKAAMRG